MLGPLFASGLPALPDRGLGAFAGLAFVFLLDGEQAIAAEAVAIVGGDKGFGVVGELDAAALALGDIAHFAFEGGVTAAAMFGFVLAHRIRI